MCGAGAALLGPRDLGLDAARPLRPGEAAVLDDAFDESDLPWRIDIVDLVTCSERFRREIEGHAVPFVTLDEAASAER